MKNDLFVTAGEVAQDLGIPYTTGSKWGLETRVSLKQALAALGFKGGTRRDTEWNQWVAYEKSILPLLCWNMGLSGRRKVHMRNIYQFWILRKRSGQRK